MVYPSYGVTDNESGFRTADRPVKSIGNRKGSAFVCRVYASQISYLQDQATGRDPSARFQPRPHAAGPDLARIQECAQ